MFWFDESVRGIHHQIIGSIIIHNYPIVTENKELKELSPGILIIPVLAVMISILSGPQLGYATTPIVLNMTNTNTTDINDAGGNATIPDTQKDFVSEDDKMGGIASLPGKCLGSALCPD
jgi:hypothetical protein